VLEYNKKVNQVKEEFYAVQKFIQDDNKNFEIAITGVMQQILQINDKIT